MYNPVAASMLIGDDDVIDFDTVDLILNILQYIFEFQICLLEIFLHQYCQNQSNEIYIHFYPFYIMRF